MKTLVKVITTSVTLQQKVSATVGNNLFAMTFMEKSIRQMMWWVAISMKDSSWRRPKRVWQILLKW
jgi:hypothetical protein